MALGVETDRRGRSVIATQTFGPGATIAVITGTDKDNPSVAIPDSPHLADTCHYCLAVNSNSNSNSNAPTSQRTIRVRACTGCKTAHYCSTTCQKADWGLVHGKGECKTFKRVRAGLESQSLTENWSTGTLPTPIRALIQILLRPEMLAAADELEGHFERERTQASGGTEQAMIFQARAALHYMGREESHDSIMEAIEVLCQLQVNSFNRLDVDTGQSGVYVNTALAMLNHSCIPNAFVQFVGRKAILHAFQEIKKGEEIEISYIDVTLPRSQRREALKTRYNFDCVCPRCREDLDVYQVCQRYPQLELNSYSLVPDINKLRNPPVIRLHSNKSLQKTVEELSLACSTSLQELSSADRYKQLGERWDKCRPLRKADLYAIDPLNQVLNEASTHFVEQGKFAYALAVSCFLALESDPYRAPMPFGVQRVKGLFKIAKLLSNTATTASTASTAYRSSDTSLPARLSRALGKVDQVTLCQAVLTMGIHYCPAAHSTEWPVYHEAKDLLNDIESLPGRDKENALVNAFNRNPSGLEENNFFKVAVLEPVEYLAGFAVEIMEAEFGR
ncbi:hypothetical protein M434DRAFT_391545 [Hypoxylon sp. CO27-5]|nr:hypothetical protein M434DRAFT_391545 [Hypoxylon sp. CO27-5]